MVVKNVYCYIIAFLLVSCSTHALAQSKTNRIKLDSLTLSYYNKLPQEKIYVHTDKSVYTPGDTVWFRAYVLDAATNQLADRSKFVYVELLDNVADTVVYRKKIKETSIVLNAPLNNDTAKIFANALPLSKNLKEGLYTLCAYTQWMRNFGEEYFFKKQLQVVSSAVNTPAPNVQPRHVDKDFMLSLHPEGGNLLAGINQRLAFKATESDGWGVDVNVRLTDANGNILQEGKSQHLGMGYILVFAEQGKTRWLEATADDGRTCRVQLPEALPVSATIHVQQRHNNLSIQAQKTADFTDKNLAIIIYGAGNLLTIEDVSFTQPIRIPTNTMKPGVINIALVNNVSKQVYAERLVFIRK